VSNLGGPERLFAQIKREKGKLDIVFANAGVGLRSVAALGAITEELYDWTFDINVKGLLFTVQKALPLFAGWRFHRLEFIRRRTAKGCQSIAFTAPPKPPFVRTLRGRGQPT